MSGALNFQYGAKWQDRFYAIKQVAPVAIEEQNEILFLKEAVMRISYHREVDALYIRLLEGQCQCRTLRLSDEVSLNIGPGEELVGIEILDARDVLGKGSLPTIVLENVAAVQAELES